MKKSILFILICFGSLFLINQHERSEARNYYYNEGYRNYAIELLVKRDFNDGMTKAEQIELENILND